jgi:hypothetical protein
MRWSDIPFRPSTATLRWFAVFGVLFLGLLAGWQFFRHDNRTVALVLLGLAVPLGVLGVVRPSALRPVFVGAMVVAYPLNWLTSHVLLAVVFYCLFTPVGLLFRLVGRDALARRFPDGRETYWAAKPGAADVRRYFRMS